MDFVNPISEVKEDVMPLEQLEGGSFDSTFVFVRQYQLR